MNGTSQPTGGRAGQRHPIVQNLIDHRFLGVAVIDGLLIGLAVGVSLLARHEFDFGDPYWGGGLAFAALAVGLHWIVGTVLGTYTGATRYGSFDEVAMLARTTLISVVLAALVNRYGFDLAVPRSVSIAYAVLAFALMGGVRYLWRLELERRQRPDSETAEKVVIYGAGEGGEQVIRALMRNREGIYYPVALLDDDRDKAGYRISNVRVEGRLDDLPSVATAHDAQALVVAIPSAPPELLRRAASLAEEAGLRVLTLPPLDQMLDSPLRVSDIQPVSEEDLLGRGHIDTDVESIAGYLAGKRVLVTGAGGSIGSELCRQIHRFGPEELIMLDRDESLLHAVQLSIDGRGQLDTRALVVADIRDRERIEEVFDEWKPQVVFHAAALKHVPLLEMYPDEGYKTNVLGTQNILDCAAACAVERFVNISTDKAADPVNVLGHTKREAEARTAAMAATVADASFMSVRFGNVLGSRGSVLTAFRQQIARGGPVTVTHPEVTRYFMTIGEAVQLVIQAGAIGKDGEVLILDMGEPVRIADVAQRMVDASGRDIDIVHTGLRDGEKLHEVLMDENETGRPGPHSLITHVKAE